MVAQTHPFKVIKEQTHDWDGVHTPDNLRDNPDHPHSFFGEGHKNTFAEGGLIPDAAIFGRSVAAVSGGQPGALPAVANVAAQADIVREPLAVQKPQRAALQSNNAVQPLPDQARGRPRRGRAAFADGGKVEKEDKQTSGTKDISAGTAVSRLKGRALKLKNAERAAEGLPPLKASDGLADGGKVNAKNDPLQHRVRVNDRLVEVGGDPDKLVEIGPKPPPGGFNTLVSKKEAMKRHKKQHPRK